LRYFFVFNKKNDGLVGFFLLLTACGQARNVLVRSDMTLCIADFGMSKVWVAFGVA
jgi:hypothetical protein